MLTAQILSGDTIARGTFGAVVRGRGERRGRGGLSYDCAEPKPEPLAAVVPYRPVVEYAHNKKHMYS